MRYRIIDDLAGKEVVLNSDRKQAFAQRQKPLRAKGYFSGRVPPRVSPDDTPRLRSNLGAHLCFGAAGTARLSPPFEATSPGELTKCRKRPLAPAFRPRGTFRRPPPPQILAKAGVRLGGTLGRLCRPGVQGGDWKIQSKDQGLRAAMAKTDSKGRGPRPAMAKPIQKARAKKGLTKHIKIVE